MKKDLKGIIPPLITPLDENGFVCEKSVQRLIEYVAPHSIALMPCVSAGEGHRLSIGQWVDMVDYTIKYSNALSKNRSDPLDVFVGLQFRSTEHIIEYGLLAKEKGAAVIVVGPQLYETTNQEDIYAHYERVSTEVNLPIFVNNEILISRNKIKLENLLKICEIPNIVAIKEGSTDLQYLKDLIQKIREKKFDIKVFQTCEDYCWPEIEGLSGYIFPILNIEPKLGEELFKKPSKKLQKEIKELTNQYHSSGFFSFEEGKKELKNRGIIDNPKIVDIYAGAKFYLTTDTRFTQFYEEYAAEKTENVFTLNYDKENLCTSFVRMLFSDILSAQIDETDQIDDEAFIKDIYFFPVMMLCSDGERFKYSFWKLNYNWDALKEFQWKNKDPYKQFTETINKSQLSKLKIEQDLVNVNQIGKSKDDKENNKDEINIHKGKLFKKLFIGETEDEIRDIDFLKIDEIENTHKAIINNKAWKECILQKITSLSKLEQYLKETSKNHKNISWFHHFESMTYHPKNDKYPDIHLSFVLYFTNSFLNIVRIGVYEEGIKKVTENLSARLLNIELFAGKIVEFNKTQEKLISSEKERELLEYEINQERGRRHHVKNLMGYISEMYNIIFIDIGNLKPKKVTKNYLLSQWQNLGFLNFLLEIQQQRRYLFEQERKKEKDKNHESIKKEYIKPTVYSLQKIVETVYIHSLFSDKEILIKRVEKDQNQNFLDNIFKVNFPIINEDNPFKLSGIFIDSKDFNLISKCLENSYSIEGLEIFDKVKLLLTVSESIKIYLAFLEIFMNALRHNQPHISIKEAKKMKKERYDIYIDAIFPKISAVPEELVKNLFTYETRRGQLGLGIPIIGDTLKSMGIHYEISGRISQKPINIFRNYISFPKSIIEGENAKEV